MNMNTKKLTIIGMLCALAIVAVVTLRVPIVPFPPLFYEPKDVIILIGGFMFGPVWALIISLNSRICRNDNNKHYRIDRTCYERTVLVYVYLYRCVYL